MSEPVMWETNVPFQVKRLATVSGLQPYYRDQEQHIVNYTTRMVNEIEVMLKATLPHDSKELQTLMTFINNYIDN